MCLLKNITLATAVIVAGVGTVQAASIASLDLSAQTFSVDGFGTNPVITGQSNGIGYTFTAASNVYVPFSSSNGSETYNDIPGRSFDDIHAGADFTIVFDQPITSLLVALANDNDTGDGPQFDQAPIELLDIIPTTVNSQEWLQITDPGGALAYFEFLAPITEISHTNDQIGDGWDLSFFANAADVGTGPGVTPVPLPAGLPLLAGGTLMLVALRRRKS